MLNPEEKTAEKLFTVGIAETDEEKKAIYRFRYEIYVEEMSRQLTSSDHKEKMLYDEMDEWGTLIYVKVNSKLIGTSRINIGQLRKFHPELRDTLELTRFQKFYSGKLHQNFGLITKLMVDPVFRNSQALYLLMAKAYELSCAHNVQFTFGGCNIYLLRLYEEIGGQRFGKNFQDPGYGMLTPIVWLIDDVEHMRKLHSPFYRLARKRTELDLEVGSWFASEFQEGGNLINSQLVTEEELWKAIANNLGTTPAEIPWLQGLSEDEMKKLFHKCGIIAKCYAGDQVIVQGDPSNEVNILLNGRLEMDGPDTIFPGQHFGATGLEGSSHQPNNIFAVTPAEILVLSRIAFPKFRHRYPDIAGRVLQNIARMTGGEGGK